MKTEHIIQQEIHNVEKDVVFYKGETYTYWDCGLTRNVFVNADKTKVIKFLIIENCQL